MRFLDRGRGRVAAVTQNAAGGIAMPGAEPLDQLHHAAGLVANRFDTVVTGQATG